MIESSSDMVSVNGSCCFKQDFVTHDILLVLQSVISQQMWKCPMNALLFLTQAKGTESVLCVARVLFSRIWKQIIYGIDLFSETAFLLSLDKSK